MCRRPSPNDAAEKLQRKILVTGAKQYACTSAVPRTRCSRLTLATRRLLPCWKASTRASIASRVRTSTSNLPSGASRVTEHVAPASTAFRQQAQGHPLHGWADQGQRLHGSVGHAAADRVSSRMPGSRARCHRASWSSGSTWSSGVISPGRPCRTVRAREGHL